MYKRALGETFQFLYIWPLSTLRSTIGVNTIRPIKENFQWHFGGAAYCLSKQGFGGDTCTFFARSSHEQASNIKAEQFKSFTRANYEHKVAAAISVFSSQAIYDRLYIYPEATLLVGSKVGLQDQ